MNRRQVPTFREEFPTDYTVPEIIANDPDLDDISWHNDVCPSFTVRGFNGGDDELPDIRLWVNHPVRDSREWVEQPRLWVNDGERSTFFESEDDTDAAKAIEALKAACAFALKRGAK